MKIRVFSRLGERNLEEARIGFTEIKAQALAAEAASLDSFWVPDHLIYRPHEPDQLGCWEVFAFLSALASVTTSIGLGTFVAATLFRNPALLAKMADALDEISNGRFRLGLGAGNWESEHVAFGYPFDRRASRFEEAIHIISPLLREGRADFHGEYYEANDCVLSPRGPSPTGPPIYAGAKGERMLRIAARHADGCIAIWPITSEQVREQRERMIAACLDVGRDPATLELVVGTFVHLPNHGSPVADDRAISGTEGEIAAQFRAFAAAGVDQLVVDPRPDISLEKIEQLGRIATLID
jgi:alkanesulfonate monooxygenase SsuD/methylene tetrahydromethanopterin reductase-like flavin-dependent oxidoreductase (luciferase family)